MNKEQMYVRIRSTSPLPPTHAHTRKGGERGVSGCGFLPGNKDGASKVDRLIPTVRYKRNKFC